MRRDLGIGFVASGLAALALAGASGLAGQVVLGWVALSDYVGAIAMPTHAR